MMISCNIFRAGVFAVLVFSVEVAVLYFCVTKQPSCNRVYEVQLHRSKHQVSLGKPLTDTAVRAASICMTVLYAYLYYCK